jgi:hypothetical protein
MKLYFPLKITAFFYSDHSLEVYTKFRTVSRLTCGFLASIILIIVYND